MKTTCTKCGERKPLDVANFHRDRSRRSGFKAHCIACSARKDPRRSRPPAGDSPEQRAYPQIVPRSRWRRREGAREVVVTVLRIGSIGGLVRIWGQVGTRVRTFRAKGFVESSLCVDPGPRA